MPISQFELYHGVVLSQIIRHPKTSLKLIERNENQYWASYSVMDNRKEYVVYVKYATKPANVESKRKYHFTFTPDDIKRIRKEKDKEILVCLVCGAEEICLLMEEDLDELDLWNIDKNRNLSVSWTKNSSLSVRSGGKDLSHKISRRRLRDFEWK